MKENKKEENRQNENKKKIKKEGYNKKKEGGKVKEGKKIGCEIFETIALEYAGVFVLVLVFV